MPERGIYRVKLEMITNIFLILVLCLISLVVQVRSLDDPAFNDDVLGLIVFRAGLNDPESKLQSWNEDDDNPCDWVGVKCDYRTPRRVSDLNLDGFSLSGHVGRSLLRLRFLRTLTLSKNNFTGIINPVLTQIENLRVIDLSENNLSGPIPFEMFQQCGSLRAVSFARNNLTGTVPDSLSSCSTLQKVNFSHNQLSGQLPSSIWSLGALRLVDFSDNSLEGFVPSGIGSLYDLRAVSLRKNKLIGPLPEDIGDCLLLESLDFSQNNLSGDLPNSMQKLGLCRYVRLNGNSFTGSIPDWIGEMRRLEILDLSGNNFSGEIPKSAGRLQFLKELNLSTNQFAGSLPESLPNCINLLSLDVSHNVLTGNLSPWIFKSGLKNIFLSGNELSGTIEKLVPSIYNYQSLEVLDLSANALSGKIPSIISNFSSLRVLNMSKNSLSGVIPSSIRRLNNTQVIDLSHNQLNGRIPPEIGGAVSLQELRLERNFLTGIIPTQIENCSSLDTLVLSQNNLTGSVPADIANLSNLQVIDLSFNHLSGGLPKELANLSHLIVFNVSYNRLQGELPVGGFFNNIASSSVAGNPLLCGSVFNHSCPAVHPKPIVLNPNSSSDSRHGSFPPGLLRHKKIILSVSALIAIGAAVLIALGVVTVTVLNLHARTSRTPSAAALAFSPRDDFSHSYTTESNHGKLVVFGSGNADFAVGAQALLNKNCELGRGGFGAVYRAILQDGRCVAIKKLNVPGLMKSQEDFEREVQKLGKIKHLNLLALEGYYWTPSLQLLIYEYMCEGSLFRHLHEQCLEKKFLAWQQRFNIILGTAKGLAHLHRMNVIHYNIKSSNVLIDSDGEAKVGDFGLARLLPMLDHHTLSSKIQSALGYMAPEFACRTVKITEKCDVYGFGILSLEVVTGKRPVEYMEDDVVVLCDMVRGALEEGRVEECIDSRLQGKFPVEEAIPVVKLGLICASQVPSNRPDMEEVVRILQLVQSPSHAHEELE